MAWNCSGSRRAWMPSGSSNTGRKTPNTPGSRREGEHLTGIGAVVGNIEAARSTACMLRHRRNQHTRTAANPQVHTANNAEGSRLGREDAATGDASAGATKGSLICSTRDAIRPAAGPEAVLQVTWLPSMTSNENGSKNFNDAASHRPYRAFAEFLRSVSVNRPATAAITVDCQI